VIHYYQCVYAVLHTPWHTSQFAPTSHTVTWRIVFINKVYIQLNDAISDHVSSLTRRSHCVWNRSAIILLDYYAHRNRAHKTMDLQFARPRDAVAAADDLQYTTTNSSSSNSSKESRLCKVLLKPRTFSGFAAAVTTNKPAINSNGSSTETAASEVIYTIDCLTLDS
jgi:hypothetical protein